MSSRRQRFAAVMTAIGLVIALGACAKMSSLHQSHPAAAGPVAPGQPGFDIRLIDEITPGLTAQQQIRNWFGEPDTRRQRYDGTSEWIYNKARLRTEDPRRAARLAKQRQRARAAQAKRLREESIALLKAGRREIDRFGRWLGRFFLYPPSPRRSTPPVAVGVPADKTPAVEEPISSRIQSVLSETREGREDDSRAVTHFDLALTFTRDGVVDEYRYQRTADRDFIP